MSTESRNIDVDIDGETFSLVKVPHVESQLVQRSKESLLGLLDLASLVDDLGKLGNFIRIAYNGVAGSTDLRIKVQRVGYKITALADKTAVAVQNFKRASSTVLQELQGTYEFLLDGLETMALATLSLLSTVADDMATVAEEVHKDFKEAEKDVKNALEDTQTEKGCQEKKKKKMKEEQQKFEMKREQAEALRQDATEVGVGAGKLYDEAQHREDKALDSQGDTLKNISNLITNLFGAGAAAVKGDRDKVAINLKNTGIASNSGYKEAQKYANNEKLIHLEDAKQQREIRRKANEKYVELTAKIKNCKDEERLVGVAIEALHSSIGALKSLSTIMMNAALFWKQMQKHCENLATESVKELVEKAMEYPDEERIKVWTSTTFKKKAVGYYSQWVALDDVCGEYMLQIKKTRKDLYEYLQENPGIEESRETVRMLASL